ncbi:MAG: DNA polymerase III subunit beta [Patescibacteria group bacterium]|nr:DNA polymerase III subunit beta [Patescibacteria group bacterium]MBU2509166.1 DNA polymerase III subunit beta [Patescibacteria group bacterium]
MNFACTQENLVQGLNMVSHVTGKNVNLPVLGNVLLKTENGNLRLSTTNLELAVSCVIRGKVQAEGEYSVPAKLLLDYVSLLPTGKIELELKEEGLEVRSNDQETIIKGLAASEFPLLPKLTKNTNFQLGAEELKRALNQVTFASSSSESRPELTGVACFFNQEGNESVVIFAATDSYRLAEKKLGIKGQAGSLYKAIVPARSMLEIARITSSYKDDISGPGDVSWGFSDNQLVISYGNVELVTRLIEGSFPPYNEIIPQSFKSEVILPRVELSKAVRAASLFSRQGLFDIHIDLDPDQGTCTVASADQGTGKTKTIIKCDVQGIKNNVTLNFRYLNDGLSSIQTDTIKLAMIDEGSPVLILPEPMEEKYRYLVMPIRQ